MERNDCGLIDVLSWHLHGRKAASQESRCPGLGSNEALPEFKLHQPVRCLQICLPCTGQSRIRPIISGVGLSPLGTAAISGLLYKPQMIDEDDCGAIGGMKIGMGNRSTRRKPAPAPRCPPQIPHDQTRAQTRAAAVGSQRLTG
jgi:hypothetical protein